MSELFCTHCYPKRILAEYMSNGHSVCSEHMGEYKKMITGYAASLVNSVTSGGHVYDQAKTDDGWKPNQSGGVITAEPDVVTQAREQGEKQAKDGGGDMA